MRRISGEGMPEVINPLKGKNATQLADLLRVKSEELHKFMASRSIEKDGQTAYDLNQAELEDVRAKNDELTDIGVALDTARETERIANDIKAASERADRQINRPRFPVSREMDADGKPEDRGPRK